MANRSALPDVRAFLIDDIDSPIFQARQSYEIASHPVLRAWGEFISSCRVSACHLFGVIACAGLLVAIGVGGLGALSAYGVCLRTCPNLQPSGDGMKITTACKDGAKRCKSAAQAARSAIAEGLEREIHWRAIQDFRRENPKKTAELLAVELGVSIRLAYYILSGKMLLRMGQIGVLGISRGAGWINRVVVEPMAARAAQHKDAHDARLDARQHALEAQLAAERANLAADVAEADAGRRRGASRLFSILGPLKERRNRAQGVA